MYKYKCRNFQIIQKTFVLYRFKSLNFSELKWKSVKRVFFIFRRGIYRQDVENFFSISAVYIPAEYKKTHFTPFHFSSLKFNTLKWQSTQVFWIIWKFRHLYLYIVWISEHKFSDNSNNYFYTFLCIKIQRTFVLINCYLLSRQNNRIS